MERGRLLAHAGPWLRIAASRAALVLLTVLMGAIVAGAKENGMLRFDELYSGGGVLGFQFSEKVRALESREVVIRGFMAPPLKAEAAFFVLTRDPVALCPFCQSDSDWPDNIVVVYLDAKQTFVQHNAVIEVRGILETGSFVEPETGFELRLHLDSVTQKK